MPFIIPDDLTPFAIIDPVKAEAMIEDAESQAFLTAPCLPALLTVPVDETPEAKAEREAKVRAVKSILRGAILRWNDAGSGGVTTHGKTAGVFGEQLTFQPAARRSMFWPSEIEQLQGICSSGEKGKAYAVEGAPAPDINPLHSPFCNLRFGANWCSCGADIAGVPIYEELDANNP